MEIPKEVNDLIDNHITAKDIAEMESMTEDEKIDAEVKRLNNRLKPMYDRKWVCPKCNNKGMYFKRATGIYTTLKGEIIKVKDIVLVECNCKGKQNYKKI